jgi:hypothetical protein
MRRTAALLSLGFLLIGPQGRAEQSTNGLPDRETFLAAARKRLAGNQLLQSRYTFHERGTQVRYNPLGRMGTGPLEEFEVYPMPDDDLTYRRLISRDGVPVPPAELAQADREYLERYRQWQRELAREGQSERAARERRQEAERAKDRARAQEAVALFEFTLTRREMLDGEPAVVIAFRVKPNIQPQSREARIAASFAGEAWVHEFEHEVMRVDARAVHDTVFGFGIIARLHRGTVATFKRAKVANAWLPVETRVVGTGRAMLFRKVQINYLRQYSHYRPFDPERIPDLLGAARSNK